MLGNGMNPAKQLSCDMEHDARRALDISIMLCR